MNSTNQPVHYYNHVNNPVLFVIFVLQSVQHDTAVTWIPKQYPKNIPYIIIVNILLLIFFSHKNYHKVRTFQRAVTSVKLYLHTFLLFIFSVRLLSVLRGHSFFHPRHNGQWPPTLKDFLSQILSITFIFLS